MPDFETYLMRHGEFWILDIVERIEHNEGILVLLGASLEERWKALQGAATQQRRAA
jgi:hypothetical protein